MGSPHKERYLVGEDVNIDLLSPFPQKGERIVDGLGGKEAQSRSTMGAKLSSTRVKTVGEEDFLFLPLSQMLSLLAR
jgi:hypothetical protein